MADNLPAIKIGLGDDTHRLGKGGPLKIGGICIDSDHHAIGHSDADVLMHAITDAILGALSEPDIGRLFPDDASENHRRDSADFLSEAVRRLWQHQMQIVNLDCVILAEQPKMSPHIDLMKETLAPILGIETSQLGIKAKTGESVDAVGRSEAISAKAVVLIAKA
ncbi:2-C-methyl-D-erythritol 2,4-cyclodiphosphate synthase [bacterium]|nr:2-C-methyl-D-erythritol 2,4-cyclodiphosphate synthase [bacterium]